MPEVEGVADQDKDGQDDQAPAIGNAAAPHSHTTHWRARMDNVTADKVASAAPSKSPSPSPLSGIIQRLSGMAGDHGPIQANGLAVVIGLTEQDM